MQLSDRISCRLTSKKMWKGGYATGVTAVVVGVIVDVKGMCGD